MRKIFLFVAVFITVQAVAQMPKLDWVGKGNDYGFVVIEVFPMELIIRFVDIQLIILKEIVISKPLPSHQSSS